MRFQLHPDAFVAFNKQATEIAEAVVARLPYSGQPTGFRPDVHVAASIGKQDVLGPIEGSHIDGDGNPVNRFIEEGGRVVGFDGAAYSQLRKLARTIQSTDAFREKVSVGFVEDALFHWSLRRLKDRTDETACDCVAKEAENKVHRQGIWVPIYGLHIQSTFKVGPVILKTISRRLIDEWQQASRERFRDRPEILFKLDRDRKELQGFAAVTCEIEAEPERAKEIAWELADRAISLLRLLADANFDPRKFTYCAPLGSQQRHEQQFITVRDGKIVEKMHGLAGKGQFPWVIDDVYLREMSGLLSVLTGIFEKQPKTPLEELTFDALLLYSKAALMPALAEKLLYMFGALESLLLRNSNEPVTENVSERLAYLSADELETRLAARKSVKEAYSVRSKFVHHGKREDADLTEFFRYAWTGLCKIAEISCKYSTKSDLLDDIEQYKYRK